MMISIDELALRETHADPLIGAVPLTGDASAGLLGNLLDMADGHCLAFDLDSTLLNNRPRNAVIMREFAAQADESTLAAAQADHFQDWSARNAMAAIGLPADQIENIIDDYWAFWSERFFTSAYCKHDIIVPGAADFVSAAYKHGGEICYLTGRHEGMRAGTEASLQKLGFPVPGTQGVQLLMKPDKEQSDDLFKVEALQSLSEAKPVLAAFDNEPTHINSYRSTFPNAVCVHLLTDHSMREVKLLKKIVSILDFIR